MSVRANVVYSDVKIPVPCGQSDSELVKGARHEELVDRERVCGEPLFVAVAHECFEGPPIVL